MKQDVQREKMLERKNVPAAVAKVRASWWAWSLWIAADGGGKTHQLQGHSCC